MLQEAVIPIPFAGGIETKQDPKQVTPARLLDLENGVFTRATTISKRNGYRALARAVDGSGYDYTTPQAMATRDGAELIVFAGEHAYSYRPSAGRWSDGGRIASLVTEERALVKTGTEQAQGDAATNTGVTVVAWVDSRGGVWGAIAEEASGRVLVPARQLGTAQSFRPRCVAVGTRLHVYYAEPSHGRIDVALVDALNPALGFVVGPLIPDFNAAVPVFDAVATDYDADHPAVITWASGTTSANAQLRLAYVHQSGVLGSATTGLPAPITNAKPPNSAAPALAILWSPAQVDGRIYVVRNFSALTATSFSHALAQQDEFDGTAGYTSIGYTLAREGPAAGAIIYVIGEVTAATERDHIVHVTSFAGSFAGAPTDVAIRGSCIASKGFTDAGGGYAWIAHDVPFFSVYLLLRLVDLRVVARTQPITAYGRPDLGWLPSVTVDPDDARRWRSPLAYQEMIEAVSDSFAETGMRWVIVDFDHVAAWQTAQLGRGLYLAAACPLHYDGDRWAEAGFHYAVDGALPSVTAGGAGLAVGVYTYRIVYEEIDAAGEVHRGPVSVGQAITQLGPGTAAITLTAVPTYRATARRRVRIGVFRSEVDSTAQFFRVSSLDPLAVGANGFLANDPTVDTVQFTDAMPDGTLIQQEELYTDGGVLSNDPPPWAGTAIAVGKDRIFWTDPADPNMVRYSQPIADGFAVDFASPLALRVDPYGGSVVNLAVMDATVIAFCESAIYAFAGPGPAPAPASEPSLGFSPVELVTGDVGLADPKSIALSPIGLAFKSSKGIQLLDRARTLQKIGGSVEAFDGQTVVRATLMPDTARILFLTADGFSILYDYDYNQWSKFTNHEGLDSVVVGGSYHYLRADGRVFVETPGVYADDASPIRLSLQTAWIKLTGYLQGWQRIWYAYFLGEFKSAHMLRVRYALDYEPAWSPARDLDVENDYRISSYGDGNYGAGPYGGSGSARYQRRIHLNKRCQAIRFWIQDVEAFGVFGPSFELSELLVTGGVVSSKPPIGATRSS